jgi:hypothetical protein
LHNGNLGNVHQILLHSRSVLSANLRDPDGNNLCALRRMAAP